MTNPCIRLGVVGTGLIWSTTHKQALAKLPREFEIVALCTRSEASQRSAAADFPDAIVCADYYELVDNPDIDAVVVCTPISLNAAVTIAALDAGKHVFVEKPFAASVAEADRVIAAEKASGRSVCILENLLYTGNWRTLKDIFESGEIGKIVSWDKVSHGFLDTKIDPWGYGRTAWRVAGEFPLGPLFDGGVHELALHSYLFGPVESVAAHGQKLRPEHGEHDNIQMLFTHQGGIIGMFAHSGYLGGNRNPFTIRGTAGLVAVEGDQIFVEGKLGSKRIVPAETGGFHDNMWAQLARMHASGESPYYTTVIARHDIATLEAISRSLHGGGEARP